MAQPQEQLSAMHERDRAGVQRWRATEEGSARRLLAAVGGGAVEVDELGWIVEHWALVVTVARKQVGLSPEEAAKAVGVNKRLWMYWEEGERGPGAPTLVRFLDWWIGLP